MSGWSEEACTIWIVHSRLKNATRGFHFPSEESGWRISASSFRYLSADWIESLVLHALIEVVRVRGTNMTKTEVCRLLPSFPSRTGKKIEIWTSMRVLFFFVLLIGLNCIEAAERIWVEGLDWIGLGGGTECRVCVYIYVYVCPHFPCRAYAVWYEWRKIAHECIESVSIVFEVGQCGSACACSGERRGEVAKIFLPFLCFWNVGDKENGTWRK